MASYTVRHFESGKEFTRPPTLINPYKTTSKSVQSELVDPAVEAFHRTLPDYGETELHELKDVASELGIARVFVKDESTRFGLPAFKILGASWAIQKAVCRTLSIPPSTPLDGVKGALTKAEADGKPIRIVTCTEGNWGRACAKMSKYLGMAATIYVPGYMSAYTQTLLRSEGAKVCVMENGTYEDSVEAAKQESEKSGALMVMDVSFDGYVEIPQWVTDGYSTMLTEADRQVAAYTGGEKANTFFASVGVGSWAHAVVARYMAIDPDNKCITTEPSVSASFKEALHTGGITPIVSGDTIMAGMIGGTVSQIAWPILRDGTHAAITVTDLESHQSVEYLQSHGVNAGPCGAANLAALRKYVVGIDPDERKKMIVVLFSTEGWREYQIPA